MVRAGYAIQNPHSGERIKFLKTTGEIRKLVWKTALASDAALALRRRP